MAVDPWLSPALSMTLLKEETMLVHPVAVPGSGTRSWTVLGDDDVPVVPVDRFLAYLTDIGRSPNTIKGYVHDLKNYWEFIRFRGLDWREARLEVVPHHQSPHRPRYRPEWDRSRRGAVAILPPRTRILQLHLLRAVPHR